MLFTIKKLHSDKKNKDYYALVLYNKNTPDDFVIIKFLTEKQALKIMQKEVA